MTRGAGKKEPEAMPPQAAKWADTLPYHAATIDLLRRGTVLSGDTTMVHGDVRTCSRDRNTLDAVHQSARHAGKKTINQNGKGGANPGHDGKSARHAGKSPTNQNGKGGANPGHDGKSYMTLVTMRPSPGGLRAEKGGRSLDSPPPHNSSRGLSETIVEVRRQARTPPGQVR